MKPLSFNVNASQYFNPLFFYLITLYIINKKINVSICGNCDNVKCGGHVVILFVFSYKICFLFAILLNKL